MPVSELVVGTHFGKDGFGDLQYDHEPDLSLVRDEPAAVAISRIVKRLPGQVDLICLAPLTNIALASKLDEDFFKNVRGVYIMGGNYEGIFVFVNCFKFESLELLFRYGECWIHC